MTKGKSPTARQRLGAGAEEAARNYLIKRGYVILAANWRCRWGELDIVCREGNCLVFVEVKSTGIKIPRGAGFWVTEERINRRKQRKMELAALDFLSQNQGSWEEMRFDAVIAATNSKRIPPDAREAEWEINHIKDAFRIQPESYDETQD